MKTISVRIPFHPNRNIFLNSVSINKLSLKFRPNKNYFRMELLANKNNLYQLQSNKKPFYWTPVLCKFQCTEVRPKKKHHIANKNIISEVRSNKNIDTKRPRLFTRNPECPEVVVPADGVDHDAEGEQDDRTFDHSNRNPGNFLK